MLPPHMRKQVERRMLAKRFSDYEGLAEWVRQQGYDISGDSLWRYGKSLKREFTATQFSLLQARMLAAQAPDHKGRLMQALLQVVQQKLFSALAQEEAINHAEITRLVHAVADLGRVSFAHQRRTAEVRRRKKARRRREEDALIARDLQELLLDPHDDIPELDAELAQSTMEATQIPADEHEPAGLNNLPSRLSPDHED
jgi:hypothetical protein